jgi:hypothetical protein
LIGSNTEMEDQDYVNDIQCELRKKFKEREIAIQRLRVINKNITKLSVEKNSQQGLSPVKMTSHELAYAVKLILKELIPASKAFLSCASAFEKDASWSKRIVRYTPLTEQLMRVLDELEEESNYELMLLKKYGLLNLSDLKSSKTLSSLMSKLKCASKLAKELNERDVQIKKLQEQSTTKNCEIESLQRALSQSLFLSQRERVVEINRLFPKKTDTDIANDTKLTRQTVSKYLKEAEQSAVKN